MTHPSSYVLRVEGINFAYQRDQSVLKGVSFNVERGQIVCLLGPSGCGKSTLLRVVAGLLQPTTGRIWIDETDQVNIPTHKRNLGFVFQDAALFPHLSVEKNIYFPFKRGRRKLKEPGTEAVNNILKLVQLESYRNKSVSTLSGGQAQRVALARALVYRPSLLLLDEPLSSLDNRLKAQLSDLLVQLHDQYDASFIYVTHDEREALRIGTHLLVLNDRHEIEQFGSVVDVLKNPATASVAAIIGGWNLLNASVSQEGSTFGVRLDNGHLISQLTLDYPVGAKLLLGLPISAVRLSFSSNNSSPELLQIPVRITRRIPCFTSWSYECLVDGEQGRAPVKISSFSAPTNDNPSTDKAFVHFRKEEIRVFQ